MLLSSCFSKQPSLVEGNIQLYRISLGFGVHLMKATNQSVPVLPLGAVPLSMIFSSLPLVSGLTMWLGLLHTFEK